MAKFCPNCGKEINENADICLNCGVTIDKSNRVVNTNNNQNKKKGLPTWAIVLIVLACVGIPVIIFALLMTFTFSSVNNAIDRAREKQREIINKHEFHEEEIIASGTIGDTLTIDGINVTLNKALIYDSIGSYVPEEGSEYLVFFFDIENTTGNDKLISTVNFDGESNTGDEHKKLIFIDIDGVSNLNSLVESESSISGYVVFEVSKSWQSFDITYSDLLGDKEILFNVVNDSGNDL